RHARAGLPRRLERERRRGDGQHDPGTAGLRGELARRARGRRDAVAGEQPGAVTVVGRRLMPLIAAALVGATVVPASAQPSTMPAVEAIRRAIVERMGDVEVNVREVALPDGAPEDYVAAVPDPGARLGRPIR